MCKPVVTCPRSPSPRVRPLLSGTPPHGFDCPQPSWSGGQATRGLPASNLQPRWPHIKHERIDTKHSVSSILEVSAVMTGRQLRLELTPTAERRAKHPRVGAVYNVGISHTCVLRLACTQHACTESLALSSICRLWARVESQCLSTSASMTTSAPGAVPGVALTDLTYSTDCLVLSTVCRPILEAQFDGPAAGGRCRC